MGGWGWAGLGWWWAAGGLKPAGWAVGPGLGLELGGSWLGWAGIGLGELGRLVGLAGRVGRTGWAGLAGTAAWLAWLGFAKQDARCHGIQFLFILS